MQTPSSLRKARGKEFRNPALLSSWIPHSSGGPPVQAGTEIQPRLINIRTRKYAMAALTGMVRIHAQIIRSTTVHLMALDRLAKPTPMMAAEMLCVVETGIPSQVASPIMVAELVSAANPLIGCVYNFF